MNLKCDSCFLKLDLHSHRPKSLPCGHTICKECVENPALRKCPTCMKAFEQRRPQDLPDNAIVVRLLEDEDAPPSKKPKTDNPELEQLQRGADAGRKVVEMLRLVVPLAVTALNRELDSSVTNLARVEAALELGAAGAVDTTADASDPLQLAEQLEASHRLLTSTKCAVAAEEQSGSSWTASVQPGGCGDILRLLLLLVSNANLAQQRASGEFQFSTVNGQNLLIRTLSPPVTTNVPVPLPATPSQLVQKQSVQAVKAEVSAQEAVEEQVASVSDIRGRAESVAESSQEKLETTEQPTQQPAQPPPIIPPSQTDEEEQREWERSVLAGQPPGTVIKCITAQVVNTGQGPRIVLQGVQGSEFTQQQLASIQFQVKEQLLQAQAKGNKASVLGPTKIYLAVRPNNATPATPTQTPTPASAAAAQSPRKLIKPAEGQVAGQQGAHSLQVNNRQVLANGQPQTQRDSEGGLAYPTPEQAVGATAADKFVITPDFIQQTIRSALKQDNPSETLEKLLQLQRYQEKLGKQDTAAPVAPTPPPPPSRPPAKQRPDPQPTPQPVAQHVQHFETPPPPERSTATKVAVEPKPSQKLLADGQLGEIDDAIAVPATPAAAYVGPPLISVLTITEDNLDNGRLQLDDILRSVQERWSVPRSLRNVQGDGSEDLLRAVGPYLEELEVSEEVHPSVMEEVLKMSGLRRLEVKCTQNADYPDLPVQLEELIIDQAAENQLRCLEHMPRLRSLAVINYDGPNLTFPHSRHDGLLWLGVGFDTGHKSTMLSLIRAHASSVQELRVYISTEDKVYYFPDLGQELAASGLRALRRLTLSRPDDTCQAAACLVQRREFRSCLPPSVDVVCIACQRLQF